MTFTIPETFFYILGFVIFTLAMINMYNLGLRKSSIRDFHKGRVYGIEETYEFLIEHEIIDLSMEEIMDKLKKKGVI